MSMREKIAFVVMCSTGEYSSRNERVVAVIDDEEAANEFVDAADRQWRAVYAANPRVELPENDATDAEWEKAERAQKRRREKIARLLTLDPGYQVDDYEEHYDGPTYYSVSAPLVARAAIRSFLGTLS